MATPVDILRLFISKADFLAGSKRRQLGYDKTLKLLMMHNDIDDSLASEWSDNTLTMLQARAETVSGAKTFTALQTFQNSLDTNSIDINSSTLIDGVLDEDDMVSDSATKLATQQSIKAYVDASPLWTENAGNVYRPTGNVGVGNIASPTEKLEVDGTVLATAFTGGTDTEITSGSSLKLQILGVDIATMDGGAFRLEGNRDLVLKNNSGDVQFVNTSGNLDILLDSSRNFDVEHNSVSSLLVQDSGITLYATKKVNAILDEDDMVSDSSEALATQQSIKAYVDASADGPVWTENAGDVYRATGMVAVGTTNPDQILHLEDTTADANVLIHYENDARKYSMGVRGGVSDSFILRDIDAGADRLTIDTSGNVGIGTATPSTTLHVTGDVTVDGLTASQGLLTDGSKQLVSVGLTGTGNLVRDTAPTLDGLTLSGTLDANTQEITNVGGLTLSGGSSVVVNTGSVYFNGLTGASIGAGSGNLAIDADPGNYILLRQGRVGIGNDTPASTLDVLTSDDRIANFRSTDANGYLRVQDSVGSFYLSSHSGIGAIGGTSGSDDDNININLSTGNVRIGNATPGSDKLRVDGTVRIGNDLTLDGIASLASQKYLAVKGGLANDFIGTGSLNGTLGSPVNNTNITANDRILVTRAGTSTSYGHIYTSIGVNQFVVYSTDASDDGLFVFFIVRQT